MKAIKIKEEHFDFNSKLLNGAKVDDVKLFNTVPDIWNNMMPFSNLSNNELEAYGFYDVVSPDKLVSQKYGELIFDGSNFIYEVIENENYTDKSNEELRILEMEPSFNIPVDSVSNVSYESTKIYNEFNGLKESTSYVNESDEIVAKKLFTIYNENDKKGTKVDIEFYNKNNTVQETVTTIDYYTDQQIKAHKRKCTIRVYDRLLWDIEVEMKQLNMIVDYFTDTQKEEILSSLGVNTIEELDSLPEELEVLFNEVFKVQLIKEIDIMYKTGDSTEVFDKIMDPLFCTLLDQLAVTSELGYTYRQILQSKFNPINFNFYDI